MIKEC